MVRIAAGPVCRDFCDQRGDITLHWAVRPADCLGRLAVEAGTGPSVLRRHGMSWSIPIGVIAGTVVRIHLTFLILLAWIGIAGYASGGAQRGA